MITLTGYLTEAELRKQLAPIDDYLSTTRQQIGLLVDCTAMTGFDMAARTLFTQWNHRHRSHIRGVAVIADDPLWHMAVATMAIAARQNMKCFYRRQDALDWLKRMGYPALTTQI